MMSARRPCSADRLRCQGRQLITLAKSAVPRAAIRARRRTRELHTITSDGSITLQPAQGDRLSLVKDHGAAVLIQQRIPRDHPSERIYGHPGRLRCPAGHIMIRCQGHAPRLRFHARQELPQWREVEIPPRCFRVYPLALWHIQPAWINPPLQVACNPIEPARDEESLSLGVTTDAPAPQRASPALPSVSLDALPEHTLDQNLDHAAAAS
jgi:hypothetical protein